MPYATTSDLPSAGRRLPPHAQGIVLSAFNKAWQFYVDRGAHEQEEVAFRVAWAAVKRRCQKQRETWVPGDR